MRQKFLETYFQEVIVNNAYIYMRPYAVILLEIVIHDFIFGTSTTIIQWMIEFVLPELHFFSLVYIVDCVEHFL